MDDMNQEEIAESFKGIRAAVAKFETDIQSDLPANKKLLVEAEAKQGKILDIINDKLHEFEIEKVKADQRVKELEGELDAALVSRTEAEKQTESAVSERAEAEKALNEKIKGLQSDLDQSISM
ncbi:MAG: hypothetical protein V3S89_11615, partial [Desulfobacterales bacterium]